VLSREVAPLGIKVTIVEPGGFRTNFAGSSTKLSEGNPDYDSTVGATARFQRDYNGKQPGDPKKAAQAIVRLTQEQKPPLRLLLGSDAYNGAEKNDLARLEEARSWKELSLSTDFEPAQIVGARFAFFVGVECRSPKAGSARRLFRLPTAPTKACCFQCVGSLPSRQLEHRF
jgi:hypothetical protein